MSNEYYYSKLGEFRKQFATESYMDFLDNYHNFMVGMGYVKTKTQY